MTTVNARRIELWLLGLESRALEPAELATALAARLATEVPIARLAMSIRTKHPEVWVLNVEWARATGTSVHTRSHALVRTEPYVASPAEAVHRGADSIRGRLRDGDKSFPLYDELRAAGLTDYYLSALVLGDGQRTWISFATDAEAGFSDEHIALFDAVALAATVRIELAAARHTTRSLLGVYLGENAASRVLSGAFRRGTGELVRAAIVFSDIRGFTSFADKRSPAEVVETLDRFFEAVGGSIQEEGGEILKFIGDAVLAIFRVDERSSEADACARALRSAEHALAAVSALNAERSEPLNLGIALHLGDVMYGNIGARDRLDFTVIGAAVNEASRIEGLCKVVSAPLLASQVFVDALEMAASGNDPPSFVSAGTHAAKGVGTELEVFTRHP